MLFILGLIVRALARLLRVGGRDDGAKDLEIRTGRSDISTTPAVGAGGPSGPSGAS
jgi:hypothetical protein